MVYGLAAIAGLAGCATVEESRPAPPAADAPGIPWTLAGPIARAWSSADMPLPDGGSLLAVTSDKAIELWRIGPDRVPARLGEDDGAGYHPDHALAYDWDGDGVREVLVAGEGDGSLQLWQQTPAGGMELAAKFPATRPLYLAAGDLDADGQPDIVSGPYSGEKVSVFWGRGGFAFERQDLEGAHVPAYPALVDWDGDGRPDIVWSDWFAGTIRVARNGGGRRFDVEILYDATKAAAPRMVVPADLDRDGHADLVVTLEVGGGALVLYGDGQGNVTRTERIPAPGIGYQAAAWAPEEGLLALSCVDLAGAERVVLVRRQEGGGFELRQTTAVPGISNLIRFADVDGDGATDLVAQSVAQREKNGVVIFWGPLWERAVPRVIPPPGS